MIINQLLFDFLHIQQSMRNLVCHRSMPTGQNLSATGRNFGFKISLDRSKFRKYQSNCSVVWNSFRMDWTN